MSDAELTAILMVTVCQLIKVHYHTQKPAPYIYHWLISDTSIIKRLSHLKIFILQMNVIINTNSGAWKVPLVHCRNVNRSTEIARLIQ